MKPNASRRVPTLILFLMIFVVLAALLAINRFQSSVSPAAPQMTAAPLVFAGLDLNQIQAIRLRSPSTGKTFTLVRAADGAWTAPDSGGIPNATEADIIARTMVLLPATNTLDMAPDLANYGFTPEGVLAVEIVLASGETHALAVGYRTPTENGYYALVDDRYRLYVIERSPIDYLISRLKNPPIS